MNPENTPVPGHPETYQTAPNDHRRWGASREIVLVPIRDPKRGRTVFAKVEQTSFDSLPEWVRHRAWCLVKDSGAKPDDPNRFTVRVGNAGNQVTVSRLIMKAKPGECVQIINGNRLDLRTTNLRFRRGALGRRAKKDSLATVNAISSA
ncbi:hypothetical protein [Mesorhizobium sp. YM1C-6-2]|uniref:hypothetical protein n=1 Tax=Mesorhizobium sp. YM1C-6-2 TaxID=1827501 RepID=UPI000EF2898F|nr:hypothetical protein [Mesorhizobium sp. YM1C-6-2]RLP26599.1 hypothetical protein D8676_05005 [Mesorhizobium sp. YM1C-6-2]